MNDTSDQLTSIKNNLCLKTFIKYVGVPLHPTLTFFKKSKLSTTVLISTDTESDYTHTAW